jgi:hypothetical protein
MTHQVFIVAVGSNLGDRFQNIASAISLLRDPDFDVVVNDGVALLPPSCEHPSSMKRRPCMSRISLLILMEPWKSETLVGFLP